MSSLPPTSPGSPRTPELPGSPGAASPRTTLDSWKQIASHLNRDVRTAQRWEKQEGLPVHRHVHQSRGTVFAYTDEVDAWLRARTEPAAPLVAPGVAPAVAPAPAQPSRVILVAALVALPLIAFTLWLVGRGSGPAPLETTRSRLAILPFDSLGEGLGAEASAADATGSGLHEELISRMASLAPDRLAVIGRTSALRYAEAALSIAEIGAELSVDHVVEGSVRASGDGLRINVRLLRAREQDEVWSDSFDIAEPGVPDAERALCSAVAQALAGQLLDIERLRRSDGTQSSEARSAWLRGRYLWHKGQSDAIAASLEHFEAAIAADPEFAQAHVGLANAYNLLGRYGARPASDVYPQGKAAALRALELDPSSGEAHAALAMVAFYFDWDFDLAAKEFAEAVRLAPGVAFTHHVRGHFLSCLGRHEEALVSVRRARDLEPFWPLVVTDTAWFHFRAGRFEDAAEESRRALQLEPDNYSAARCLSDSLLQLGQAAEAWVAMRSWLDESGRLAEVPGANGAAPLEALRQTSLWEWSLIEARAENGYVSPHSRLFTLARLGRRDDVLDGLEAGVRERCRISLLLEVHPLLAEYREEPRFRELVATVGLPYSAPADAR